MLYKKGQGLSMNVIIIAAIALLVLVILSVLVIRSGRDISESGKCIATVPGAICSNDVSCPDGFFKNVLKGGKDGGCYDGEICCIPLDN